jgi:hypothetical protein
MDIFVRADQADKVKSADTFRFPGEIGKFMQYLQPFKLSITLRGDKGSGKTTFAFQLCDGFIECGFDVGLFSLEQGGLESIHTRDLMEQYIKPGNRSKLAISGEAAQGIDTIKQYAKKFDVIVIDSWGKLKLPNTEFDSLRQEFPDKIWVVVFQENSECKTRGGPASDYDAPVVLKTYKVDATFVNNYVYPEKNRGNDTFVHYRIAQQKCEAGDPPEN